MNEGDFYTLEKSEADYYGSHNYRFCSLYNGTRGPWCSREKAIEQGNKHAKIILALYSIKPNN